ncbi:hypothetical protein HY632_04210 [Candidatus Uhrbacteria bacterium]|nr:hypothetical protein [Candidatus Uhrbacteria bacterium]
MPTPLKTLLRHLHLSDREAEVYLASLRLGEADAPAIAHAAKLPRTTTASILDRLRTMGYVSLQQRKGRHVYWIEDPHLLVEQEQARLDVMEQLAARLHTEYHQADRKPSVETFETPETITLLMTKVVDELPRGSEILTWESPAAHHYQAIMSDELYHALARKKDARSVRTRALIPAGEEPHIRPAALAHRVEVRTLPGGLLLETSCWIFNDAIVLFSGTHSFAVRINHRHTAESHRSLFQFLWSHATPFAPSGAPPNSP